MPPSTLPRVLRVTGCSQRPPLTIDSAPPPSVHSARIWPLLQHFDDARGRAEPQIVDRPRRGPRMPVTARLSKRFYEVLGEDVANELVEWFNAVDATYRAELREANESNFARFDAKLGQRIAELKSELLKWMFLFWATTGLALGGLFLRK